MLTALLNKLWQECKKNNFDALGVLYEVVLQNSDSFILNEALGNQLRLRSSVASNLSNWSGENAISMTDLILARHGCLVKNNDYSKDQMELTSRERLLSYFGVDSSFSNSELFAEMSEYACFFSHCFSRLPSIIYVEQLINSISWI